ncbi:uncharacterized protein LOC132308595 [Cornus florida]|uniref:uncharacterized protein LOC132308595 n=1 Tax=Cornus florida TaxID=4283 RepID=UPI0028A02DB2|nr:uncharacterized protein LOC132308595 [Cornus florida]
MIETSMVQEAHTQKYSNSSSGGGGGGSGGGCGSRSSKKLKQKKVPQRGLGVAQLEKIRLEEQQKKDAAVPTASILPPNSIISPNSSCLAVQGANFRHNPSPSSPLPPPSPTHFSSKNSIFRPAPLIPNLDVLNPNSVPFSKPLNVGDGEIGWSAVMGSGHGNWSKLWNCEYNLDGGENHRLDHHGFTYRSNMNLPFESWPPQNVMHRAQQFQQPSSSSMVNVSSGTSSSSVINFQMEPPSNQSHYGNYYTPICPEEEKMVGVKRSYPFSLDNPTSPSFRCKFPPTYLAPHINRSDESASCGNGGASNIEPGNPVFRESPLSSTTMYESNSDKISRGNGGLNGDFLTLAPPTASSPRPSTKYKTSAACVVPYYRELSEVEPLPCHYQGSMEEPIHRQGPSGLIQQQPFYNFFLNAKAQIGQAASTVGNCSGEVGGVDLNLKL